MSNLLRQFIREQIATGDLIGAKGFFHNYDKKPYGFDEVGDYDYDIVSDSSRGIYILTIMNNGKQVGDSSSFHDYDDAVHQAKLVIDKHKFDSTEK